MEAETSHERVLRDMRSSFANVRPPPCLAGGWGCCWGREMSHDRALLMRSLLLPLLRAAARI